MALASRKNMCIHDKISQLKSVTRINAACLDLQRGKETDQEEVVSFPSACAHVSFLLLSCLSLPPLSPSLVRTLREAGSCLLHGNEANFELCSGPARLPVTIRASLSILSAFSTLLSPRRGAYAFLSVPASPSTIRFSHHLLPPVMPCLLHAACNAQPACRSPALPSHPSARSLLRLVASPCAPCVSVPGAATRHFHHRLVLACILFKCPCVAHASTGERCRGLGVWQAADGCPPLGRRQA